MSMLNEIDTLVLIIDIQEKLINAVFNKAILEKKSVIMANTANIMGIPTIVTEQYPKGLGETISSIKNICVINSEEGHNEFAKFYEKTAFSALNSPDILNAVQEAGKKQVIVFGIETHICVSQTVYSLINKGHEVFVIADACGSRSESEHKAGLDRMKENGAHIITTEIALFELLRGARHPKFKLVQGLIK